MKKFIIMLFIFSTQQFIFTMEEKKALHVYAIPGQNGLGSEQSYIKGILGNRVVITAIETPENPDLGQETCIKPLRDALATMKKDEKTIIYATSQGAASALNRWAEDTNYQIKAMILEAPLVSGNSAILHTLKGPLMNLPTIASLPFAYYWIPYFAKILYPRYWPAGKQPIKAVEDMPINNIPIILIHSKNDPQLSYDDTCALYCGLRAYGNKNVYLISKPNMAHINIISENADKRIIQNILKKHGLLSDDKDEEGTTYDLSSYQPNPAQFKDLYDNLMRKENNHEIITNIVGLGVCGVLLNALLTYIQ
jgi:hypothetical protein